jgi:hypothetical protein
MADEGLHGLPYGQERHDDALGRVSRAVGFTLLRALDAIYLETALTFRLSMRIVRKLFQEEGSFSFCMLPSPILLKMMCILGFLITP